MKQSHRPLWGAMAMCILLSGCTPDELVWDLPDTNPVHVDNAPGGNSGGGTGGGNTESLELCGSNNCSQISSVNAELTTGPSWRNGGSFPDTVVNVSAQAIQDMSSSIFPPIAISGCGSGFQVLNPGIGNTTSRPFSGTATTSAPPFSRETIKGEMVMTGFNGKPI